MLHPPLADVSAADNADDDDCLPKRTDSRRVSQAIHERVLLLVCANEETQTQGNGVRIDNLTGGQCHATEEIWRGSLARNKGVGSASPLFLEINLM